MFKVAAVAEWYRYRTVACFVTGSSPVPLKTRRVGQRGTLNLSRADTSSRWWVFSLASLCAVALKISVTYKKFKKSDVEDDAIDFSQLSRRPFKPLSRFLSRPQKFLIDERSEFAHGAPRLRPNSIGSLRQ
ncbi:hypothetical protein TNCV_43801 [Trichonephila clavipes]|nr:hypothetical protein TNCV_43801 [Trichonephila clavipes]